MTETYKLMTGKYDKAVTHFMPKQESSTSLLTWGHSLKIYKELRGIWGKTALVYE